MCAALLRANLGVGRFAASFIGRRPLYSYLPASCSQCTHGGRASCVHNACPHSVPPETVSPVRELGLDPLRDFPLAHLQRMLAERCEGFRSHPCPHPDLPSCLLCPSGAWIWGEPHAHALVHT